MSGRTAHLKRPALLSLHLPKLWCRKPEVVVYTEMVATSKTYIRGLTLVQEEWLHQSHPEYFRTHRLTR